MLQCCVSPVKKGSRLSRVLNKSSSTSVFTAGDCTKKACVSTRENLLLTVADLRTQLDGQALEEQASRAAIELLESQNAELEAQITQKLNNHLQEQETFRATNADLQSQIVVLKRQLTESEASSRKLRTAVDELNEKMAQQLAGSVKILHDAQAGRELLASQIHELTCQLEQHRNELGAKQEAASTRAKELAEVRNSEAALAQEVTMLRDELMKQNHSARKPSVDEVEEVLLTAGRLVQQRHALRLHSDAPRALHRQPV